MSNLGYFQLKANPGMWHLSLAEGRSEELYFMDPQMKEDVTLHFESEESRPTSLMFVLDSLSGRDLRLNVMKRPGHEADDVLDIPSEDISAPSASPLLDKVLQWAGIEKTQHVQKREALLAKTATNWQGCEFPDDPVNVFTIASGHMYERLQKIMILSVLRHTTSCVKFWFIKNYMSPQIKEFLPHFAKKYKFEYGLITYKWPIWLQHQTEKQRKIWAYKILFLDVLFPSNVRKVLFLDSDQIIRTDIRLLYDMDIQGAPLAYTPFCDNNKEMDGFRFWKQGFWESHLQGRPYHISALYVVDLVKFRQMAAGDHLRIVYEQLSKDPNSLANLDQDLPNYTQHQVPIFSLPQEWLWCESWCGNETKHAAKTIDLCNNPLTKEPKLQAARRIVSEWTELDGEAHQVTLEVEKQHFVTLNEAEQALIREHDGTEL